MAFKIKQNDTRPRYVVALKDNFGQPGVGALDLETATGVDFVMREVGETGAPKVKEAAVITDAENGIVTYTWGAGDTDAVGEYQAEFEITWEDGGIETVPNGEPENGGDAYFTILVVDDLG